MFYPNMNLIFITLLLLPQVFVQGGILRELRRKFLGFFKWSRYRPGPFYDNCNLCTFGPCTPMVWPTDDEDFDASKEAETVMNNLTPLGGYTPLSDYQKITVANTLKERSAMQRTAIAEAFQEKYSKAIHRQLSLYIPEYMRYCMLIEAMSIPLPQFYHGHFRYAIESQTKDKDSQEDGQAIVVEMLTTLPQCLMDKVTESYNEKYARDLIPDLDTALTSAGRSSEYRQVIRKLIEQKKDTNQRVSWIKALKEAYKLKSAVISERETEMKERFAQLFTERSIPQIIETIAVYENLRHGEKDFQSLSDEIDKKYNGDEKDLYAIMIRLLQNKPLYYAKIIQAILKSGKEESELFDKRLIFILVGRYDIDLKNIVDSYNQQSETGFRADFEAWDTSYKAKTFHSIVLDIIDTASKMS